MSASQPTPPTDAADLVVERARERLGDRLLAAGTSHGQASLVVAREDLAATARLLRDDPALRFVRLADLCGVDYLGLGREPRFAVVYHFHSLDLGAWARVSVPLAEDDAVVPSLAEEWPAADWYERETFDLLGIRFAGHPNLTRIVTPDGWEGHPLRKDYPFEPEQVEYSFNVDRVNAGRVVRREQ